MADSAIRADARPAAHRVYHYHENEALISETTGATRRRRNSFIGPSFAIIERISREWVAREWKEALSRQCAIKTMCISGKSNLYPINAGGDDKERVKQHCRFDGQLTVHRRARGVQTRRARATRSSLTPRTAHSCHGWLYFVRSRF